MAWEWVGPVATVTLGAVGIYFTYLTGDRARAHAAKLADEQLQHARTSAVEERDQQRKAETYVRCLEMAEQIGHWSQAVRPALDTTPPAPAPPLPSLQEQVSAKARLSAFGSPEVTLCWEEWEKAVGDIRHADFAIGLALGHRESRGMTGINYFEIWAELDDKMRPLERERRHLLAARIHEELTGTTT
jgi:hypothetical protein